jgi:hypothetical protein
MRSEKLLSFDNTKFLLFLPQLCVAEAQMLLQTEEYLVYSHFILRDAARTQTVFRIFTE